MTPEAEVLHALIRETFDEIWGESVTTVPIAGRVAYGCRSASASYDLQRRGGMAGVLRCGDRLVVSVPQLVAHVLGEIKAPIEEVA